MNWRPIETAPKNQTEVLVFAPDEDPPVFTAQFITSGWSRSVSGYYKPIDEVYGDNEIRATHWMPLPEPLIR